jgi:hypothetical protein
MESLFEVQIAKRRELPPAMRRLIVDLKAEYPAFDTDEIAGICCYVRFGRKPEVRTVRRVLEDGPIPRCGWSVASLPTTRRGTRASAGRPS